MQTSLCYVLTITNYITLLQIDPGIKGRSIRILFPRSEVRKREMKRKVTRSITYTHISECAISLMNYNLLWIDIINMNYTTCS